MRELAACCLGAAAFLALWGIRRELLRTGEIISPTVAVLSVILIYAVPRGAYLLLANAAPESMGGLLPSARYRILALTNLLILSATAVFLLGRIAAERRRPWIAVSFPDPDPKRLLLLAILTALAGFVAYLLLIARLGGFGSVLSSQVKLAVSLRGQGSLVTGARLLFVAIGLLFYFSASRRHKPVAALLLAFGTTVLFSLVGRRSLIAFGPAFAVALYHLTVQRIRPPIMLWTGAIAIVAFVGFSYFRLLGAERAGKAVGFLLKHPRAVATFVFSTGEFRLYDGLAIIARDVPAEMSPNYGASFARVPIMLVPRRLWEDKPLTLGEELVQRNVPRIKAGHPPLLIGELYAAAGLGAVLLGMTMVGYCCGVLMRSWLSSPRTVPHAILYILAVYFFTDLTRVGDLSRTLQPTLIAGLMFSGVFIISRATPRASDTR